MLAGAASQCVSCGAFLVVASDYLNDDVVGLGETPERGDDGLDRARSHAVRGNCDLECGRDQCRLIAAGVLADEHDVDRQGGGERRASLITGLCRTVRLSNTAILA